MIFNSKPKIYRVQPVIPQNLPQNPACRNLYAIYDIHEQTTIAYIYQEQPTIVDIYQK
jgi:hypothetical protein